MIRCIYIMAVAMCLLAPSIQAQVLLLEDFSSGVIPKNDGGYPLWEAYLGEDGDQTYRIEDGMFKVVGSKQTGCGTTGCGVYWHFMPYPYVGTTGFAKGFIKSGAWDADMNRLRFRFKCSKSQVRNTNGSGNYYVGTYVKTDANYGYQGMHYYHNLSSNVYANRWLLVEITRKPNHQVGAAGSTEWPDDPEWVNPTTGGKIHYFDGLTRWYFDTTGGDDWSGETCYFDDFGFEKRTGEADSWVSNMVATHSGSAYEVTWNAPKNRPNTYDVRYATSSMKTAGFTSGTDGGSVSAPGNDYTAAFWKSPNMAEARDFYVAIRPRGQTVFTEIHVPAMNSAPSGSPCDVDGDGSVSSTDVSAVVAAVLGKMACSSDLDGNGRCDVVDVQRVINASTGGSCRTGQ